MLTTLSAQGAPHLLHSRAPQIYTHLVLHLLQIDPPAPLLRVLVLLTTSLIHHGSATAMQPIHEFILKLLKAPITESPMEDVSADETTLPASLTVAQMELVLRLSATLLGVRKGQRLPTSSNEKTTTLQTYMIAMQGLTPHVATGAGFKREYLKALTGALVAGKVKDWLSPGISLIKATWQVLDVSDRLAWVRVLVRVGWKGIEQFILADIARFVYTFHCSRVLHTDDLGVDNQDLYGSPGLPPLGSPRCPCASCRPGLP